MRGTNGTYQQHSAATTSTTQKEKNQTKNKNELIANEYICIFKFLCQVVCELIL